MTRRICILGLALALCLPLEGCASLPDAHEIEQTVLMEAMGVDVGAEALDGVAVTAASGARAAAGDSPGQAPVVLSAQAGTVAAACAEMQTFGEEYVFYGDVEEILLGEGEAQRGLEDLLTHMARDPELRLEAQLWVMRGSSAADALFGAVQGGGAPARLAALEQDARRFSTSRPRTARETLADLLDNGCTLLPALVQRPAGPGEGAQGDMVLSAAGYAVLRDGALCGYLEGGGAYGADLLSGRGTGKVLELETPGLIRTALRVTGVKTRLEPVFDGERLAGLAVECALEARAVEVRGGCLGEDERVWLAGELSRVAEAGLREAMDRFQALGADCAHLGGRAALRVPWRKAALEAQWEEAFPTLSVTWDVNAEVARG